MLESPRIRPSIASQLLLSSLLLAPAAPAQEDEEARQHGIFLDSVEVSLINLEVFASRDGEPVTDLTIDDFEVFDDGQRVEITHFTPFDLRTVEAAEAEAPAEETPADEEEAGEAVVDRRHEATIVIVVDQLFLSPISRKRVFDAAVEQLDALVGSGARVMVVDKDRSVSVEQEPTANPALVRAALERLAQRATPGYDSEIETTVDLWQIQPDAVESRQSGPGQPGPALQTSELDAQRAYQDARAISLRIHDDVRTSFATLRLFLDSLAGLPGRKALIYVADRLPTRPAEVLWRIWWEKYGIEHGLNFGVTMTGPADLELSQPLEELISDANTSRVAFYPVGAGDAPRFSDASSRGLPAQARGAAVSADSRANDGLQWLASRSGGRFAVRVGNMDNLFGGLVRDLATYYSIAYASPHSGDGKVHKVEITVRREGLELRYPTEYRDKSQDQRTTDRTLSALTVGVEDNPLGVRVSVGKAKRQGKLYVVPIDIHVPMANVVILPDGASHRGNLSVQLIARDAEGRYSDPVVVRLPFEVANSNVASALSQTVDYSTEMTLREGNQAVAIGVKDELGFTGSTVRVELDVGGSR